jgi:hypothetical protein
MPLRANGGSRIGFASMGARPPSNSRSNERPGIKSQAGLKQTLPHENRIFKTQRDSHACHFSSDNNQLARVARERSKLSRQQIHNNQAHKLVNSMVRNAPMSASGYQETPRSFRIDARFVQQAAIWPRRFGGLELAPLTAGEYSRRSLHHGRHRTRQFLTATRLHTVAQGSPRVSRALHSGKPSPPLPYPEKVQHVCSEGPTGRDSDNRGLDENFLADGFFERLIAKWTLAKEEVTPPRRTNATRYRARP